MRRYYILLIGTLAAACATYAQQLTGRVVDTQNQPIEFANVALYALPDSALVTGTITDAHGDFTLEGGMTKRALLKISFVGYEFPRRNSSNRMLLNEFTRRNSSKRRPLVKITQRNASKRRPLVEITQRNASKRGRR